MVKKFTYLNLLLYVILWLVFLVSFVAGMLKGGWFVYHYAGLVCFILAPFFVTFSLFCLFFSKKEIIKRKYFTLNVVISVLYVLMLTLALLIL